MPGERDFGEHSPNYINRARFDLSPTQFNIAGIDEMREQTAERGAELRIIHIPYRQELQLKLRTAPVRDDWDAWRQAQPELCFFPQLPEDHYYDLRHPNTKGRDALSRYFVDWLEETPRGRLTTLFLTIEDL
ncbi:MAG: hypothetical protein AAFV53_31005 [Myxococcota bacterium]